MCKFEVYIDRAGYYRWRLKAENGEIVADSAESFMSKYYAKQSAEKMRVWVANAIIVDLT